MDDAATAAAREQRRMDDLRTGRRACPLCYVGRLITHDGRPSDRVWCEFQRSVMRLDEHCMMYMPRLEDRGEALVTIADHAVPAGRA